MYRRAKDSFLNFVEGFYISIDTSFVNDADDKLRNQIQKILKLKLHQDQSAIFGISVNCGEIEAEYKHLVSFKYDELKNITEHKAATEAEKKHQGRGGSSSRSRMCGCRACSSSGSGSRSRGNMA